MRLQELLAENITLLEYNRDITAQNYGRKIVPIARRDRSIPAQFRDPDQVSDDQLLDLVMDQIEKSDPTQNKEYAQALAKIYGQGQTKFEDMGSTLSDYLIKFDKLKRKKVIPSPRNDFMRYTNIGDFLSVVDEYPDVDESPEAKGKSHEIYKDSVLRVIQPINKEAACYYGRGTRWCTAANTNNMFDTYASKGELFILIPQRPEYNGEKYQLHFESRQFMNEKDHPVPMIDLVKRFPQLKQIFYDQAHNLNIKALILDTEEYEKLLRKFPEEIRNRLLAFVNEDTGTVIKNMLVQLLHDAKILKELVDPDEFKELAWEAFNDEGYDLVNKITRTIRDIDTWQEFEARYDIVSDAIADWTQEKDFYQLIMDELESIDELDLQMDCAIGMNGEILNWLDAAIEHNVRELI